MQVNVTYKKKKRKRRFLPVAVFAAVAAMAGAALSGCSEKTGISGDVGDLVVEEYILTESPNYKRSGKLAVQGIMLHSIGMAESDAKYMADIFGAPDYDRAGVHAFIDSKTGVVYQTLPWNRLAWHCGDDGMYTHIGVEMCETDASEYDGNTLVITDAVQAKKDCKTAYDSAVKLFAKLCDEYDLDPLEDGVIISHSEGYERGIATNHGDPEHYWDAVGLGYTMDGFREDVAEMLE